jgi:6-pyruvoyltetrahydropterin/6-carboxytetrahydropterin synthase
MRLFFLAHASLSATCPYNPRVVELTRTVRFCLNGRGEFDAPPVRHNTFSAWPAMRGLGRYYELHVRCCGQVNPDTGYFINITLIDKAVREHVLPRFAQLLQTCDDPAALPLGSVMQQLFHWLAPALDGAVTELSLQLSPFYSLQIRSNDMNAVIVRQQFEFSSAHRLHVDAFTDQENRDVFGKCNNPSGHGHNYRLEVAVTSMCEQGGQICSAEKLDELVNQVVVERLDHKHLNLDVEEFRELNPSVENIAKVIHQWLVPSLEKQQLALEEVSVWETGKTVCTYRG